MGISTTCIVTFYNQAKEEVYRHDIEGYCDKFIYSLIKDSHSSPDFSRFPSLTPEEQKNVVIQFDKKSMTVIEYRLEFKANPQEPEVLKPIWLKILQTLIEESNGKNGNYYGITESELEVVEAILRVLDIAITSNHLVEITAVNS